MADEIFPEIRSTKYTVFTKSGCKYCDNIKICSPDIHKACPKQCPL